MSQAQTSFSVKSSHPFVNPQPTPDSANGGKRTKGKGKKPDQQPQGNSTSTHSATGHAIRQVHGSVEDFY